VRVFVIGGGGFVGSAYIRLFDRLGIECASINRANYAEHVGRNCDVLINANGNSQKYLAERDPKTEFDASVRTVVHSLEDFRAGIYVFLSTGDVYVSQERPEVTREELVLDPRQMSRYGLHKFMAESFVRALHPNWLIIRMGGFVGPGLRKNAIFDMLNDKPVWLDLNSELQFISTDHAAEIVWTLVNKGIRNDTLNLAAKGVMRLGNIYQRLGLKSTLDLAVKKVRFEISTENLERLYGKELPKTADEVGAFLKSLNR
jgi:nucleoside-diphosphate-sugar epimerase